MMQLQRRPWLALLVCLAAASGVRAQTGAQQDVTSTAAEPTAPADTAAPALDLNWRGAPIFTSGSVSYELRASHAAGESKGVSQLVTTSLDARSYIYQPWFATVNGRLGLTMGRSRGGGEEQGFQGPFASQERFVTGNARLDLFPSSRFPFEVHAERSDSRIDSALASSLDYHTQNIGVSQRYRPASSAYTLSASFDRREQAGAGFRDMQDTLVGDFATHWKDNELSLGLSQSQARRQASNDQTQLRSLVGRHQYAPGSALSIDTTVNLSQTEEQLASAPSDLSVLQWSSVGLWHRDGSKLTLSGAVRGLLLRDAQTDQALDSLGLTLGATYELSRNARLTASGNATSTDSNGVHAQGFGGSVGAGWQGDTIEFKGLRYDWFASGSAGGSTASTSTASASNASASTAGASTAAGAETRTTIGAQLGHTLSRSWPITSQSTLMLNAGQTLAATQNRSSHSEPGDGLGSSRTLLHTVAATWNVNGDNRSAYARAAYSDSMEIGGGQARFQLFNFQLSGNFELDRNRSLSGDLTVQRVTQRTGDPQQTAGGGLIAGGRSGSTSASGEVTYRQQRLFGIPRLRFTSRLKLAQDLLTEPGMMASIPDRETRLWENRLDWLVGRLESQLVFRISEIDGKRYEFLMWRLQRSFGN